MVDSRMQDVMCYLLLALNLAFTDALSTRALAQDAEVVSVQLIRRDGSHVVSTDVFNGIDTQSIALGRWQVPRSHVRFLCFGACPATLPTEPVAQDTVVWKGGERSTGLVLATDELGRAQALDLVSRKGISRSWRDVEYIQFAEPDAVAIGAEGNE